eukprot:Skav210800  [mRNA]  locus=scaffold275:270652:274270:- [translate_table: standard]
MPRRVDRVNAACSLAVLGAFRTSLGLDDLARSSGKAGCPAANPDGGSTASSRYQGCRILPRLGEGGRAAQPFATIS